MFRKAVSKHSKKSGVRYRMCVCLPVVLLITMLLIQSLSIVSFLSSSHLRYLSNPLNPSFNLTLFLSLLSFYSSHFRSSPFFFSFIASLPSLAFSRFLFFLSFYLSIFLSFFLGLLPTLRKLVTMSGRGKGGKGKVTLIR